MCGIFEGEVVVERLKEKNRFGRWNMIRMGGMRNLNWVDRDN